MASRRYLRAATAWLILLAACTQASDPTPTTIAETVSNPPNTTTAPAPVPSRPSLDPDGSYAVVAFTNHLPAFNVDAAGAADRPWARLHTTRNYLTMLRLIAESDAKVVLSYSPVLLEQIAAIAAGQLDKAAVLTAKATTELATEDKAYIDEVFFRASPSQIDHFPRYRELADRRARGQSLSTSDYRDLQVLFNLAWSSPLLLDEEPLLSLAAKGRGFSEEDKQLILDAHLAAIGEFLDTLRTLWSNGAIEVATTPLANPTLPLLMRDGMDRDAVDQIIFGAARAGAVLGEAPRGMIPNRGQVHQANGAAALEAGFDWLVLSGDPAAPIDLTEEEGNLVAFTAATDLGDLFGTSYFRMDPNAAALDLTRSLSDLVGGVAGGVATVTIDATEPWGRYEDGGVALLRSLFRQLAAATDFTTALPSELTGNLIFDPGPYPELAEEYSPEAAEAAAWNYLRDTRRELLRKQAAGTIEEIDFEGAYEQLLQAQGSDWYWWYGESRASGDDAYYDDTFRSKLRTAWELIGGQAPGWTNVPLHQSGAVIATRGNAARPAQIRIDNSISDAEWSDAGLFDERTSDLIRRVHYSFDTTRLYIRVDFTNEVLGDSAPGFDLYLRGPTGTGSALSPLQQSLGFEATRVVRWRGTDPVTVSTPQPYPEGGATALERQVAGFNGNSVEFALDLADIEPELRAGDSVDFRVIDVTGGPEHLAFPGGGFGSFEMPNLQQGVELARIDDRLRDDYGPGGYSYITDSQVRDGTYDLARLVVRRVGGSLAADPDSVPEVQFEFTFREPLTNPWSAPREFSNQTIDLYIEALPGPDTGAVGLLPGRVARLEPGSGWDYAFSLDGWDSTQYVADAVGNVTDLDLEVQYAVLADRRTILATVPRSVLPSGDETQWRYGVAILANQAIPTLGIHGLRELAPTPNRFRLGGGSGAVNDPLIIDLLHPESGAQEAALTYPSPILLGDPADVPIDRLAWLPLNPS